MKKILFPFDLNVRFYTNAFIYAVKLARNFRAELIMLNVYNLKVTDSITRAELDNLIRENWYNAYKAIFKLKSIYLKHHARIDDQLKIKCDYRVVHGHYLTEITNLISNEEIDLLVLPVPSPGGPHKRLEELIRTEVLEEHKVSVMLIPSGSTYQPVKRIIFAADFRKSGQYHSLINQAVNFVRIFDSEIHFLHLAREEKAQLTEDCEAFQAIRQLMNTSDRYLFRNIYRKDPAAALMDYIDQNQMQILALVRHPHHFPGTWLHRDYEEGIHLKSKVPVILLKETE
jgi:hypothetical protein